MNDCKTRDRVDRREPRSDRRRSLAPQDVAPGDQPVDPITKKPAGTIAALDDVGGTLTLRPGPTFKSVALPRALFPKGPCSTTDQRRAIVEAARWSTLRFELRAVDLARIADFCTVIFVGVLAVVAASRGFREGILAALLWLPAVLAPIVVAQLVSSDGRIPLSALFQYVGRRKRRASPLAPKEILRVGRFEFVGRSTNLGHKLRTAGRINETGGHTGASRQAYHPA